MVTTEKRLNVHLLFLHVIAFGSFEISKLCLVSVMTSINDLYICCVTECNSIKQNYASVLRSTSIPNPPSKTLQRTEQLLYNCAVDLVTYLLA